MSGFEYEIYERLLEMGFSREELNNEMKKKANEFGGFMSEEAILFIIAKENSINIKTTEHNYEDDKDYQEFIEEIDYDEFTINIGDLEVGMQRIVLLGKILKIFAPREFVRKDSSVGKVGSFFIADLTGEMKIVVWNDKTEFMKNEYFTIDKLIRILGGFTKLNKEGGLEVHLGRNSEMILEPQDIPKQRKEQLMVISKEKTEHDKQRKNDMQLYDFVSKYKFIGKIQGRIKVQDFQEITKKDGTKTFLLKCILSDNSMAIRLLIWDMNAVYIFKLIQDGDYVGLQNLVVKENVYTNEKELVYTKKSSLEIL